MEKIEKLKKIFKEEEIDGYIIPKNDEFFGEYVAEYNDRLNFISNFTGSYGFALVLKDKNYLFVDGRYTLQANNQSGEIFKIITIPDKMPSDILKGKKLSIGFDPNVFTERLLFILFGKNRFRLKPISRNLMI
jgi:Creatinase/Prolidase N-terminal domain.